MKRCLLIIPTRKSLFLQNASDGPCDSPLVQRTPSERRGGGVCLALGFVANTPLLSLRPAHPLSRGEQKSLKAISLIIALLFCCCLAQAQDLNARVKILTPKIQVSNKRVFSTLETAMKDFLNGRKWAADAIAPNERIDCNFVLNITNWDGGSNFSGELQVQSSRPVYNSSYTSTLLNVNDRDVDFSYTEGQTIDYSDQNFQNNLSSVMAFYANIIVGLDYDSFSRYGGSQYFAQAQTIVTNAQTASFKGWKAFDSNLNRYWLSENLNNKLYNGLRSFIYDYHRNGLDMMANNAVLARKSISAILPQLTQIDRKRIGSYFPLAFFTAKDDEFVSIFSKAFGPEKAQAMNILLQADPSNGNKYETLK